MVGNELEARGEVDVVGERESGEACEVMDQMDDALVHSIDKRLSFSLRIHLE